MKINPQQLQLMYDIIGLDKERLHWSLRQMGNKHLKSPYKEQWTPDNPTRGYCYVVSEFIYHYCPTKMDKTPMLLKDNPEQGTHRYIKLGDIVIDLTVDQFPNYSQVDYKRGKPQGFMWVKNGEASNRTKMLADIYFGN